MLLAVLLERLLYDRTWVFVPVSDGILVDIGQQFGRQFDLECDEFPIVFGHTLALHREQNKSAGLSDGKQKS